MKIKFNTLKIEGFAGISTSTIIKLDSPGLTVIKGPNGAGKTTRFSALSWCLYGVTLKNKSSVETWEHLRPDSYQGVKVQLSLFRGGKKFTIIRCNNYKGKVGSTKGHNRLVVNDENGDLLWPRLKDKRDIQKALEEFIGLSHRVFINSIIFPQKSTKFIEGKGPERKKIFEEAFKAGWVNKALALAKKDRDELVLLLAPKEARIEEIENNIDSLEAMLEAFEETRKEFDIEKESEIESIEISIVDNNKLSKTKPKPVDIYVRKLNSLKSDLEDTITELELLGPKEIIQGLSNAHADIRVTRTELSKKEKNLKPIQGVQICPECGQEIEGNHEYHAQVSSQITELREKLTGLKGDLEKAQTKQLEVDKLSLDIESLRDDESDTLTIHANARESNLKLDASQEALKLLKKNLKKAKDRELKDTTAPIEAKLLEYDTILLKAKESVKKLTRKKKILDWVIKEPLGANGLTTFIFTQLVHLVNAELRRLELHTGFGVSLSVEGEKKKDIEAIVMKDGYPVSFYDLSGGEAGLINVMIALSIGSIVSDQQPINIRVFDESFEGLSAANVDVVGTMIAAINPDVSVFIITHLTSFTPSGAAQIILSTDES